jgi:tetratricopeptide (TPR) repeat protein
MKKIFVSIITLLLAIQIVFAANPPSKPDEGMWIPIWIEKFNYPDMVRLGLKLKANEVYSYTNPSIKDAIVGLGADQYKPSNGFFCSGVVVSPQGLVFTNHHCGYDAVQQVSTLENDYLTNGFWATKLEEEIPIDEMTMSFVVRIEDVTSRVLKNVNDSMSLSAREKAISKAIKEIENEASEKGKYDVVVKPVFEGNEYYLHVYETYKDIRLVGAPPSAIGKFGGDTDNWMWPRHTGDFSIFRIYTAPDGSPADYSKNNIPLNPKKYLPVSIKGVEKNDFAMIFGFPGSTNRYITSHGVDQAINQNNPLIVNIRDKKLSIMKSYMNQDPKIKLQYSSKYAQTSNYWKYFIGQTKGLKRWDVYDRKKELENQFMNWVQQDATRQQKYGTCLQEIENSYNLLANYNKTMTYLQEALLQGPEFIYFGFDLLQLYSVLKNLETASKDDKAKIEANAKLIAKNLNEKAEKHFKDYNPTVDKDIFIAMFEMYLKDVPKDQQISAISTLEKKYKGDLKKWADDIYNKSILVDQTRFNNFLQNPNLKTLENDLGFQITRSTLSSLRSMWQEISKAEDMQSEGYRKYIAGLLEMMPDKAFYPDANSTMRMTYGTVQDYYPADAVHYNYVTTLNGVIEKEDPTNDEFIVPERLKELYNNKDFGQYADKNGNIITCFITNNDITGGNSGSGVIDAQGNLIGLAFDGNWESMSGDILFETSVQRCISVDIRYVLFIIDKYAGATNLINELTIVK